MATKISVSKKLETQLRAAFGGDGRGNPLTGAALVIELTKVVGEVLGLVDAEVARSRAKVGGLAAQVFLDEIARSRPVVLPAHNGSERTYAQLAKKIREYGVTREQAAQLGSWLKLQTWIRDEQLTVEFLMMRLPEWLSRCLGASNASVATKPGGGFRKVEWDDA